MSGWIKLHRKTLDNPVVCKDSDHLAVWSYILLNATHKEYPSMFLGKKITLQAGQLITGRKVIAEKFNISESKVQRILKTFENEQQIEQQNGNKNRLITVLTWSDYQDGEQQIEQQVNNNRTTDEQQVNTYKNVKNLKNEKKEDTKDIAPGSAPPKNQYADYVFLTEEEYKKLSEMLGNELEDYFVRYGSWISGETPRVQKSRDPYLTIRNWYGSDQKKRNQSNSNNRFNNQQHSSRKPAIPIVTDKPKTSVSDEELEELLKLARKLDGTG